MRPLVAVTGLRGIRVIQTGSADFLLMNLAESIVFPAMREPRTPVGLLAMAAVLVLGACSSGTTVPRAQDVDWSQLDVLLVGTIGSGSTPAQRQSLYSEYAPMCAEGEATVRENAKAARARGIQDVLLGGTVLATLCPEMVIPWNNAAQKAAT